MTPLKKVLVKEFMFKLPCCGQWMTKGHSKRKRVSKTHIRRTLFTSDKGTLLLTPIHHSPLVVIPKAKYWVKQKEILWYKYYIWILLLGL